LPTRAPRGLATNGCEAGDPFTSSCCYCSKAVSTASEKAASTTRLKPSHPRQAGAHSEIEVLDFEERSLLSFQRPVPCLSYGVKKPPTRARGLRRNDSQRLRVGPGGSYCRVTGVFLRASVRTAREV
jgi:hypothetical protein